MWQVRHTSVVYSCLSVYPLDVMSWRWEFRQAEIGPQRGWDERTNGHQ